MPRRKEPEHGEYHKPVLPEDRHRPAGRPRAREIKSQKAQLESLHRHGTRKDLKVGMAEKTGLEE